MQLSVFVVESDVKVASATRRTDEAFNSATVRAGGVSTIRREGAELNGAGERDAVVDLTQLAEKTGKNDVLQGCNVCFG